MQTPSLHIEALDPKDAGFVRMLKGVSELMSGVQEQYTRCATEKQEFQLQLQEQQLEATNIVAEGKQKKLVAILNAIFEGGYITGCSKKVEGALSGNPLRQDEALVNQDI